MAAPTVSELGRRLDEQAVAVRDLRGELGRIVEATTTTAVFRVEMARIDHDLADLGDKIAATAQAQSDSIRRARESRRYYVASVVIPLLMVLAAVVSILVARR